MSSLRSLLNAVLDKKRMKGKKWVSVIRLDSLIGESLDVEDARAEVIEYHSALISKCNELRSALDTEQRQHGETRKDLLKTRGECMRAAVQRDALQLEKNSSPKWDAKTLKRQLINLVGVSGQNITIAGISTYQPEHVCSRPPVPARPGCARREDRRVSRTVQDGGS